MPQDTPSPRLDMLRTRLAQLRREAEELEDEIAVLETKDQLPLDAPRANTSPKTPAEKVALFLELFGTRRSVYPKRWENPKTGKSGYSPACDNEWIRGVCGKPQIKCTECPHQKFSSLDATAIEQHLRGAVTLVVLCLQASHCGWLPHNSSDSHNAALTRDGSRR